jgi:non-ribosomal peptide synthetase-like protein
LNEIFEARADAAGDAAAVIFDGRTTTYSELERRANRIARHLRFRGVERGMRVAMLLPRTPDAYATLLGILKSGAAYVPLDPEWPRERCEFVLEDSGVAALVTMEALAEGYESWHGTLVRVDADRPAILVEDPGRLPRGEVGAGTRDLCYVIYTSGSTGRPKGVMVEHRSACHIVRAEGTIFGVGPGDRVWQGSSLAFDASVEEMWLALRSGAALVAATPAMCRAGPDLAPLLADAGVTVLSCVPTVASMLTGDVPTLRLMILGGEACPDRLFARFARPGLRIVNTYGPTEATVVATYADLLPHRRVTIGRAVPGYRVHVLDGALRPMPRGAPGEICIGGIGVARGYVGLPAKTAERFVRDPFAAAGETDARLYRTGDVGRFDADGDLEFVGRVDGQVKVRGFRIELGEIEAALLEHEDVRAAACAVHDDAAGVQHLVAYVVPRDGPVDASRLRARLARSLPAYMCPSSFETVGDLPRLTSGKLDRASLPPPSSAPDAGAGSVLTPRTDAERVLAAVWRDRLGLAPHSMHDDFFLDLGGHSLLAARMVSELRRDPRFVCVSVADVYAHPTIASLAAFLDAAAPATTAPAAPAPGREGDARRHFVAGTVQALLIVPVFAVRAALWITPYVTYFLCRAADVSVPESLAWAAAAQAAVLPALLAVAVLAKWLLLGRIRPGRHRLWGAAYLRWWFVHSLVSALPLDYLAGTPLLPFVYRLLGAKIGRDVHLATEGIGAFDVVSIGDGACVDEYASLDAWAVVGGELVVAPIRVGRRAFVGTRSVLEPGAVVEDHARVEDLSLVAAGTCVPRGETWAGSPARRTGYARRATRAPRAPGPVRLTALAVLYAALVCALPLVLALAVVPGIALLEWIGAAGRPLLCLAAVPLVGASFVVLITTEVVALKWLLVGRVRAGSHPVHGGFYVRSWIVDRLLALSLDVAAPLRATLYMAPWFRALGARLGRFVELSTATSATPDLLEIGDGGTVADEASLGAARVESGVLTVASTRIGRRAFVGNSAVVPSGTNLGDGSLLGVLSIVPRRPAESARPNAAWLGSPPILLLHREASAGWSESRTYEPPRKLVFGRAAFEILRITLPSAGFIVVTATVVGSAAALVGRVGLPLALALLPFVYVACCAAALAFVALAKWTLVGRYRPFVSPLWSWRVWRLELVNALYEFLASPLALEALHGTPFLPWYLRLLGARIGRRVYVDTTGFLEWDLVDVGDRAELGDDCVLQTHLFEDRVLKASAVRVGADCTVGTASVVLYDSEMEPGSRLGALSLLMKGERLPAGTAWAGVPAASRAADGEEDEAHGRRAVAMA